MSYLSPSFTSNVAMASRLFQSTPKDNRVKLSLPRLHVVKSKKNRVRRPVLRRIWSPQTSHIPCQAILQDESSPSSPRLLSAGTKAFFEREDSAMQITLWSPECISNPPLSLALPPSHLSFLIGQDGSPKQLAIAQSKQLNTGNVSMMNCQWPSTSIAQVDYAAATDCPALVSQSSPCSATPPTKPRFIYTLQPASEYAPKRSGGIYTLFPIMLDGECFFTHTVVNKTESSRLNSGPDEQGKELVQYEDMREGPKEIDTSDASVRTTARESIPSKYVRNPSLQDCSLSSNKGSSYADFLAFVRREEKAHKQLIKRGKAPMHPNAMNSRKRKSAVVDDDQLQRVPAHRRRQTYIYNPLYAPRFLAGSSDSLAVYPAQGYSSPPSTSRSSQPSPGASSIHSMKLLNHVVARFRNKRRTNESTLVTA